MYSARHLRWPSFCARDSLPGQMLRRGRKLENCRKEFILAAAVWEKWGGRQKSN